MGKHEKKIPGLLSRDQDPKQQQGEKPVGLALTLGGASTLHFRVASKPGHDWLPGGGQSVE